MTKMSKIFPQIEVSQVETIVYITKFMLKLYIEPFSIYVLSTRTATFNKTRATSIQVCCTMAAMV